MHYMPEISRRGFLKLSSSIPFLKASTSQIDFSSIVKKIDPEIVSAFVKVMIDTEEYLSVTPNTSLLTLFENLERIKKADNIAHKIIEFIHSGQADIDDISASLEFIYALSAKAPRISLRKLLASNDAALMLELLAQAEEEDDSSLNVSSVKNYVRAVNNICKYMGRKEVSAEELRNKILEDMLRVAEQKLNSGAINPEEATMLHELLPEKHSDLERYIDDEKIIERLHAAQDKLSSIISSWATEAQLRRIHKIINNIKTGDLKPEYTVHHGESDEIFLVPRIIYKAEEDKILLEHLYNSLCINKQNMLMLSLVHFYPLDFNSAQISKINLVYTNEHWTTLDLKQVSIPVHVIKTNMSPIKKFLYDRMIVSMPLTNEQRSLLSLKLRELSSVERLNNK